MAQAEGRAILRFALLEALVGSGRDGRKAHRRRALSDRLAGGGHPPSGVAEESVVHAAEGGRAGSGSRSVALAAAVGACHADRFRCE
jgi:hypothetical protein